MGIYLVLKEMPKKIKSCLEYSEGAFTIALNCNLCFVDQTNGFMHELEHILRNDFEKDNIDAIEYLAHLV